MKAICYTLELQLPLLVTDVQSEPNGAVSMPYVTGSLMRGALAARYLKHAGFKTFDALADAEARALFLSTTTRYLNAYPCNQDDERALPVPHAWYYDKNDGYSEKDVWRRICNLSHATPTRFQEQGIGAAFVWLQGSMASLYTPPRQVNVHTQRDAQKGRATEQAGAVYRYDALAAGLRLQGVILTADEHADTVSSLLDSATLWLGRARRAGYGQAVVTAVDTRDYWHEFRDEQDDELMVDNELQITFMSNTLLRDANGQPTLDPHAALAAKLGVTQASLVPQVQRCFAAATVVGGFNRKWGLPLPQTTAIKAGSVFTYQIGASISYAALEALEQDGIGERRAEGFGRVVVNGFMQSHYESQRVELSATTQQPELLSPIEQSLAETIADRLLRNALEIELRRKINTIKLEKPPTKNQLARMRVVLRDIQAGRMPGESVDRDRWEQYLTSLETRRSTSEQFQRARVDENEATYPLLTWLKEQVEQAQQKWSCEPVRLGSDEVSVQAEVDTALAEEYALRLLDGVLSARCRSRNDD